MNLRLVLALALGVIIVGGAAWYWYEKNQEPEISQTPSLAALASDEDLELGVYLARDRLDEEPYRHIATRDFNLAIIDGQGNWHFEDGSMRPSEDEFDFSRVDEVLGFAQANDMPVRLHHFVWGEEKWLPEWLKSGDYSPDELIALMQSHIMEVGQRYQDDIKQWSVVNEAFTRGRNERGLRDWWRDNAGEQYIDAAFIAARKADPDGILLVNDFGNEIQNPISDDMYKYLKDALERGIPIDGIGMQMHIGGNSAPAKDDVIKNMARFGELGLKVFVTELDVNMADFNDTQEAKDERQRTVYRDMFLACIESPYCDSLSILGITDKESWYNELGVVGAEPLPFDEDYDPKPAYEGIREALMN